MSGVIGSAVCRLCSRCSARKMQPKAKQEAGPPVAASRSVDKVIFMQESADARQRRETIFAKQIYQNRGAMYLGFDTEGKSFPAWELLDVRVLRSQNTDCRKNEVFRQSQRQGHFGDPASFCPYFRADAPSRGALLIFRVASQLIVHQLAGCRMRQLVHDMIGARPLVRGEHRAVRAVILELLDRERRPLCHDICRDDLAAQIWFSSAMTALSTLTRMLVEHGLDLRRINAKACQNDFVSSRRPETVTNSFSSHVPTSPV